MRAGSSTFVFASESTSQGTITAPAVGSNGTVSAALGSIAVGGTATVAVVVKITAKAGTALSDTATVTATTVDSNSRNNSMSYTTSGVVWLTSLARLRPS